MTREIKTGLNEKWAPHNFNWWIAQKYRYATPVADNLKQACEGSDINWLKLAVLGAVRTTFYRKEGIDAFCTGDESVASRSYEEQADIAPSFWMDRASIGEVLKDSTLLFAYDSVYDKASRFLDRMCEEHNGGGRGESAPSTPKQPLPAPIEMPSPVRGDSDPVPTPVKKKFPWWARKMLVPLISGIVGFAAGQLGEWGPVLKAVWEVIKSYIGG